MKLLLTLALCLSGLAGAQFYISVPNSNTLTSQGATIMGGLAIGTYKLYGDFGVRATAQTSTVTVEGVLDGTYSYGEGIVFYTGAGLGYSSLATSSVSIGGFVGLDFDAASVISIFLEIRPTYYLSNAGAVQVRSGLNFHIGQPSSPPGQATDNGLPWLEPYAKTP